MKTKYEVYLTPLEWKMVSASFISMAIAYTVGILLYFTRYWLSLADHFNLGRGVQFASLGLFCISLLMFLVTLTKLIYGEISDRIKEHTKGLSKKQIKQIVTYCYPDMNESQYKNYFNILKKTVKDNGKTFKTMGFRELLEADKWAQTEEFLTLERKWTAQLSKQYGMNIKY